MSAAGLYDSIGGIATRNTSNFQMAVAKVWASLYTLRAILARRAAGMLSSLVIPSFVIAMNCPLFLSLADEMRVQAGIDEYKNQSTFQN